MPTKPRQPGDPTLGKDGTVKLKGEAVGVWWNDDYHWYHFAPTEGQEPVLSLPFRHELRTAIAEHLNSGDRT